MSVKSIQNTLKNAFPKTDKQEWQKAAATEINDSDPQKKLIWSVDGNLLFLPIYNRVDTSELTYLQKFALPSTATSHAEARTWNNLPAVTVKDETSANKRALDYLSTGADGILFDLRQPSADLYRLLENIEWPYCSISFQVDNQVTLPFSQLENIIAEKKYERATLTGAIFWKDFPQYCAG